jgi:pyruvate-formate lyase
MTERIRRMKKRLEVDRFPICAEKAKYVIESWRRHEGLPSILQRAHATADYLDQRTIYIDDDELICGNVASKPMGMEASVWGPFWDDADLDTMLETGQFEIDAEGRRELRSQDEFWKGQDRQMYEWQGRFYDDGRLWPFIRSGVLCPPWKDKKIGRGSGGAGFGWGLGIGLSFFVPDYHKIVSEGISKTLQDAKEALSRVRYHDGLAFDKAQYLESVIIALSAMVRMYHRYGDACMNKAGETADATRQSELLRMADTCHWIAENPSRDFRDAMQNFYFYWMMIAHGTTPGGRFDQFMYPYYKRDIDRGALTNDDVVELLQCLRIKIMQFNFVNGGIQQRNKWAGMARWHNFVIAGVDKDGNDATNELSYLIIQAAFELRVPQYTITVRVARSTPESLLMKAAELVRTGLGMPAFVSDDSYIGGLVAQGVPIEEARDYALAGCLDLNLPGKSRINALGMFIVPKVLDIAMHNGILKETGEQLGPRTGEMKDFETFEDFLTAFKTQLAHFMSLYNEEHNILIRVTRVINCDVVHSAFTHEGIHSGRDMFDRKMPYENASMFNPIGMINVVNSFAAVKKLVFEDKKFTMADLHNAIEANWEGFEDVRALCVKAPKFGNGEPLADNLARDLYDFWIEQVGTFRTVYGEPPRPTGVSITAHAPGGAYTCATPDGRYRGETLCDGILSPAQGTDTHGPLTSLMSALTVNQTPFNAALLNMKIHPSALKTAEDLKKLVSLVRTYMFNGGKHIQFNVIDNETLRSAQKSPENYRNLVVRVAGYSTYFTLLTKPVQDEIIKRTEQML